MNEGDLPFGATPLDPDEAAGLLRSDIATLAELNAAEQDNILDAQIWAFRRKRDVLSEKFLRDLHKRMFGRVWEWAGTYRVSDKSIGVPWFQVRNEVPSLMLDVKSWIEHRSYPWDEIGVRFHHRLVSIHAFPNGNGRHARLMTDLLLVRHGQTVFTWGSPNSSLQGDGSERTKYINALRKADARDFDALLNFVR